MSGPQPGQDPRWSSGQQPYPGQPYPGQQASSWPQRPYPGQQPPPSARRTGFGLAFLAALVWPMVNTLVTLIVSGPPPTAGLAGQYVGSLLIPTLLAALAVWLIARRRRQPWRFPLLVVLALPFYLVLRVLTMAGGGAG